MNWKPIKLEDEKIILQFLPKTDNSAYNFTNIYMWAKTLGTEYAIEDSFLFVKYKNLNGYYFCPLGSGDLKSAVLKLKQEFGKNIQMTGFGKEEAEKLSKAFGDEIFITPDRNNFDYIYESESLISLSGKALHQKRNHYNFFVKTYDFTYSEMTAADVPECKEVFDKWLDKKEGKSKWVEDSKIATFRLLDLYGTRNLKGGIIRVNGNLSAFSIGEKINDNTALVHVEIADPNLRGIFNAINKMFCENAFCDVEFINREEDMGLEGLRRAKLAYKPVKFAKKYKAKFN